MFCFVVARPQTYEKFNVRLMRPQLNKCDTYEVLSNKSFWVAHNKRAQSIIKGNMDVSVRSTVFGRLAVNVPIFMQVWNWLSTHYTIYEHTWVVKMDADALVDILRLRALLATCTLKPPVLTTHALSTFGAAFAMHSSLLKSYRGIRENCTMDYDTIRKSGGFYAEDHYVHQCLTKYTKVARWPIQPQIIGTMGVRPICLCITRSRESERTEKCAQRVIMQQPIYIEHVMKAGGRVYAQCCVCVVDAIRARTIVESPVIAIGTYRTATWLLTNRAGPGVGISSI